MCVVKQFCCGCTPRHGAITAAVLNVIVAVVLIAAGAQCLRIGQIVDDVQPDNDNREDTRTSVNILNIIGGVVLSLGLISLVIFICLVIGITKNIAGFVMPWLIGCMIYIVIWCILILGLLFLGYFGAIVSLLGVAFYIYLWIVVLNYYRELCDSPPSYTPEIKA